MPFILPVYEPGHLILKVLWRLQLLQLHVQLPLTVGMPLHVLQVKVALDSLMEMA
jgi:hypothetical protein